ncbi:hypothetical protein DR864_15775 [Runella rosea]|uniref:Secretion system C-terminal sorting domain-containing protein n=2 Tax=Runella rosea TaxID=2259595 RepID=A0A344TKD3_9BACT|nr:hypothetical protein DR864_15775 [Runella rosea]
MRADGGTLLPNFINKLLNNKNMKTLLFSIALLFGMGIYSQAMAQSTVETPSFTASIYPVVNTSKVRILISKEYGEKFSLSIIDDKKNLIYFDQLSKKTTQHRFDLNMQELANGRYYVNLSNGKQPVVTKVIIKEQVVLAKPILSNQILCVN